MQKAAFAVLLISTLAVLRLASAEDNAGAARSEEMSREVSDANLCRPETGAASWQARVEACTRILAGEAWRDRKHIAHTNRGILYQRAGRESEALADFNAAVEAAPGAAVAYLNRGQFFEWQGRPERASRDYRKALDLAPDNGAVLNAYAWSLVAQGDYVAALAVTDRALPRTEDLAGLSGSQARAIRGAAYDTRAHALMGLGRRAEARAAFARAVDLGGPNRVRRYQKALTAKGYEPGRSDGVMDTRTEAALAACIRDNCRLLLD